MGPLLHRMGHFRFMLHLCAYMEPMEPEGNGLICDGSMVKPLPITNMLVVICAYTLECYFMNADMVCIFAFQIKYHSLREWTTDMSNR